MTRIIIVGYIVHRAQYSAYTYTALECALRSFKENVIRNFVRILKLLVSLRWFIVRIRKRNLPTFFFFFVSFNHSWRKLVYLPRFILLDSNRFLISIDDVFAPILLYTVTTEFVSIRHVIFTRLCCIAVVIIYTLHSTLYTILVLI